MIVKRSGMQKVVNQRLSTMDLKHFFSVYCPFMLGGKVSNYGLLHWCLMQSLKLPCHCVCRRPLFAVSPLIKISLVFFQSFIHLILIWEISCIPLLSQPSGSASYKSGNNSCWGKIPGSSWRWELTLKTWNVDDLESSLLHESNFFGISDAFSLNMIRIVLLAHEVHANHLLSSPLHLWTLTACTSFSNK